MRWWGPLATAVASLALVTAEPRLWVFVSTIGPVGAWIAGRVLRPASSLASNMSISCALGIAVGLALLGRPTEATLPLGVVALCLLPEAIAARYLWSAIDRTLTLVAVGMGLVGAIAIVRFLGPGWLLGIALLVGAALGTFASLIAGRQRLLWLGLAIVSSMALVQLFASRTVDTEGAALLLSIATIGAGLGPPLIVDSLRRSLSARK